MDRIHQVRNPVGEKSSPEFESLTGLELVGVYELQARRIRVDLASPDRMAANVHPVSVYFRATPALARGAVVSSLSVDLEVPSKNQPRRDWFSVADMPTGLILLCASAAYLREEGDSPVVWQSVEMLFGEPEGGKEGPALVVQAFASHFGEDVRNAFQLRAQPNSWYVMQTVHR